MQKSKSRNLNSDSENFLKKAIDISFSNFKTFNDKPDETESYTSYIKQTDNYLSFLRNENKFFSHQSDLSSSVIPELFCQIFKKRIDATGVHDITVSGQEDLKIDFQIIPNITEPLTFKSKRVDVCVYKNIELKLTGKLYTIPVPLIAIENKVNLDKNMIYGIINTSEAIKKMFPESKFYVYTEFSDLQLDKHNFAYSNIDEVYTLRKQKRASFRRTKIANGLHAPLILESLEQITKILKSISTKELNLEEKMYKFGKLINQ